MNIREQVATDLKNYLSQYNDPKKAIRLASIKIGIHQKTLKRLVELENTPTYLTLYKIYREIYGVRNDSVLIQMVPEIIKTELVKENPKDVLGNVQFNVDVEDQIIADPVFMDIYFLSNAGVLTREYIQFKFGEYGLTVVSKMLKANILEVNSNGQFIQGSNQANLSPSTVKKVGLYLVNKYFKADNCDEKGNNFCGVYVEGLTPEGLNEWLKVDCEAFNKKVEISKKHKDSQGLKVFTYMATDIMNKRDSL